MNTYKIEADSDGDIKSWVTTWEFPIAGGKEIDRSVSKFSGLGRFGNVMRYWENSCVSIEVYATHRKYIAPLIRNLKK